MADYVVGVVERLVVGVGAAEGVVAIGRNAVGGAVGGANGVGVAVAVQLLHLLVAGLVRFAGTATRPAFVCLFVCFFKIENDEEKRTKSSLIPLKSFRLTLGSGRSRSWARRRRRRRVRRR